NAARKHLEAGDELSFSALAHFAILPLPKPLGVARPERAWKCRLAACHTLRRASGACHPTIQASNQRTRTQLKIFFSVGEPSGDLHGANLIRELRRRRPNCECVGYGGPRMAAAGCTLHEDLTKLAVMWLLRALMNLHKF